MTSAPRHTTLYRAAAIAFLVAQLALPAYMLFQPRTQRFGWHMYSGVPAPGRITLVYDNGNERPSALGSWLAKMRAEMREPERRVIVSGICERERSAGRQLRLVRVVLSPGEEESEVPCS